ncbi:DUF4149 domain-containing protein [Nitrogeniibacter aestuarii]|uniref:DUF4149 domain-containing protein n=1 Tax=Nitrogeniibacter aestuarii TaxID=2815343 RepID=UPI001E309B0C|nr:DUF4149 domain-containing protein [Nitrogeniibacter aestuarii]
MKLFRIAHPLNGVQRLLLTVWVGAMWAIGYVAAPVLFAAIESRMQAGAIAGTLFSIVSWIGFLCGGLILLVQWRARHRGLSRVALSCIVAMLIITGVGQFGLQPMMADIKAQFPAGVEMSGELRSRFGALHGISSTLFLIASMLGALAVWRSAPTDL